MKIGVLYKHKTSRDTAFVISDFDCHKKHAVVHFLNIHYKPYLLCGHELTVIKLQKEDEYEIVGNNTE